MPTAPQGRRTQDETVRLARQAVTALEPALSLRALSDLRARLDVLEAEQVDAALKAGSSWRVIAEALGVSRQAAHRKHAPRVAAAAKQMAEKSVAGSSLTIVGPARVAVVMARQEAGTANSRLVGTEHLLIGLVRERNGLAAKVLGGLGVTLDKVRQGAQASADRDQGNPETEDLSPPPWASGSKLPFSRRGRYVLEQARREAVRLGDDYLGVEHLLLALLRDDGSRAVRCLENLRITPALIEDEIGRLRPAGGGRRAAV